jgi:hypothetical protein
MLSKLDAAIVVLSLATGTVALEDRQRAEITPVEVVQPALANTARACAIEDQEYAMRRMTLMAFGAEHADAPPRLTDAAGSCDHH